MKLSRAFLILLALIIASHAISGCMQAVHPLRDFDNEEYVFIGEVVDFTRGYNEKSLRTTAFGLVVNVKESVHLPSFPQKYFEVFRITSFADCSEGGESLEELQKRYRVGSEVQVVAKQPRFLPKSVEDGIVRLEIRPFERGFVVSNIDNDGSRLTNVGSEFNYNDYHFNLNRDSAGRYMLPAFEIRKDLHRLKNATSQDQGLVVLRRLSFVPLYSDLDYYEVALKYAKSVAEARSLFESRLGRTHPDPHKQYKIVWAAADALMKKGFERESAEYLAKTAIEGGIELDRKKIVKAVMRSFKTRN